MIHAINMIASLDDNPDLANVSIVQGRLWLSDMALEDIESISGELPGSDDPRAVLEHIDRACAQLQSAHGDDLDDPELEENFVGWGVLRGIAHAIETKLYGREVAGPWPPQQADGTPVSWMDEFLRPAAPRKPRQVLH